MSSMLLFSNKVSIDSSALGLTLLPCGERNDIICRQSFIKLFDKYRWIFTLHALAGIVFQKNACMLAEKQQL